MPIDPALSMSSGRYWKLRFCSVERAVTGRSGLSSFRRRTPRSTAAKPSTPRMRR